MSILSEKIRKARESRVDIEGHKFTIRRPTQLEVVEIQRADGGLTLRNSFRFVVNWDLTELDLGIPGGTGAAVPFDQDAFAEWISDRPAAWAELLGAITKSLAAHERKLDESAKN